MAQTAEVVIPASQSDLSIGGGLEQTSQGASFYQPNSSGINVLQVSRTFLSFLEHLVTQSGQMRRSLVLQAHVNRRVMLTSFGSGIIHVYVQKLPSSHYQGHGPQSGNTVESSWHLSLSPMH